MEIQIAEDTHAPTHTDMLNSTRCSQPTTEALSSAPAPNSLSLVKLEERGEALIDASNHSSSAILGF